MEQLGHSPESIINDDDKNLARKSILLSIGIQGGLKVPRYDPARFYSDVMDALPDATSTHVANVLYQLYPTDSLCTKLIV